MHFFFSIESKNDQSNIQRHIVTQIVRMFLHSFFIRCALSRHMRICLRTYDDATGSQRSLVGTSVIVRDVTHSLVAATIIIIAIIGIIAAASSSSSSSSQWLCRMRNVSIIAVAAMLWLRLSRCHRCRCTISGKRSNVNAQRFQHTRSTLVRWSAACIAI